MPHSPDHSRKPKHVQAIVRHWHSGEEFVLHSPPNHPLRDKYEQALAQLAPAFATAQTLSALIAEYEAPPKQTAERAKLIEQACTTFAHENLPLLPHMVAQAAYYRRSRELLSSWWTND